MKKLKLNANAQGSALNRNELKKVLGGKNVETTSDLESLSTCDVSLQCDGGNEISITDCNGSCSSTAYSVTCQGSKNVLTKTC